MSKRLYVGNIPYTATEADIRAFFAPSKLTEVKICYDRESGRPRGFGFVELAEADAEGALRDLDGAEMGGRTIRVSVAEERKPQNGAGTGRRDNRRHDRS